MKKFLTPQMLVCYLNAENTICTSGGGNRQLVDIGGGTKSDVSGNLAPARTTNVTVTVPTPVMRN